ncbi:MAG: hypothetical protein KBA33_01390 [Cloacibacterium sp.]|jgi:hypothetical protein|nr:hypothetical protein [Cloacibacterium sp.]
MKIKSAKFLIVSILTFIIIFLMNYIGNTSPDKLQTALMNGIAGVVGLAIGMIIYNRNQDKNNHPSNHFD